MTIGYSPDSERSERTTGVIRTPYDVFTTEMSQNMAFSFTRAAFGGSIRTGTTGASAITTGGAPSSSCTSVASSGGRYASWTASAVMPAEQPARAMAAVNAMRCLDMKPAPTEAIRGDAMRRPEPTG